MPGQVKTRLAKGIGAVAAAGWYRRSLNGLVRRVGQDRRWQSVLAVSPDNAVASRLLPGCVAQVPQGRGDLGARMARALAGQGPGPVVLVGSDVPGIDRAVIARAFAVLRGHDAVIGPAADGGFWLIGLRNGSRMPRGVFQDVRWSGPHAMTDTLAGLQGLRIGFAETLSDVDTVTDLSVREIR